MEILNDLWNYVSHFGVSSELDTRLSRKIKLTNQLAFLGSAMSFIQLFAFASIPPYALLCAISIMLYSITWWLNNQGYWKTSRVYFSIISCVVILIGGCMVTEDTNFSFRFMMIQALVIPLVVFDVRETKLQIIGFLAFILSFIVFDTLNEMIPVIEGIDISKFDSPQTVIINGVLCMITLLIGNRYLQKLNYKAEEGLKAALETSNQQSEEIQRKNKLVYEGITYAQRIQQAVLPKKEEIQVFLPDHFVYFKPRDIIGGDFYWQGEHGDHILMAAVDCTGHGAPGALISIIGSQILNKIVKDQGTTDPGEVLEILNLEMINTLHHETSLLKDGMDISLISIDTQNNRLRFAGAKNSLIIMKNGEIERIRGNQTSIGEAYRIEEGFTTHEIELEKGDNLYMLTDGIIDQFGGPSNKKMLHKRLYDILRKNDEYSMDIQLDCLKQSVDLWQGNLEQTDDILIIGLRIDFDHIAQVQSFRKASSPYKDNTSIAS